MERLMTLTPLQGLVRFAPGSFMVVNIPRQEASGGLPDLYLSLKQERLERNLFLLSQTNTLI